ncbi:hypothetical protein TNCV_1444751 [Trichonephila clavipes]|nr:hypothetical protein TNCV_1444751 [Trichonephila clavipes]
MPPLGDQWIVDPTRQRYWEQYAMEKSISANCSTEMNYYSISVFATVHLRTKNGQMTFQMCRMDEKSREASSLRNYLNNLPLDQ